MLGGPSRPGLSRLAGAPGSRRRLSVLDQAETSSENKSEPSYDNHRSTTTIIGPVTNPSPATLVREWPRNCRDSSENLAWRLPLWPCVQRTNEPKLKSGVLECWRKSCAAVVVVFSKGWSRQSRVKMSNAAGYVGGTQTVKCTVHVPFGAIPFLFHSIMISPFAFCTTLSFGTKSSMTSRFLASYS